MAVVLSVSGSPSRTSRTTRLLRHVDAQLAGYGHQRGRSGCADGPAY